MKLLRAALEILGLVIVFIVALAGVASVALFISHFLQTLFE